MVTQQPARARARLPVRQERHPGFRSRAPIDDSPVALREAQVAVARARDGDRDALQFLYIRYSHNVYGYVRSIVHDDHEAEDVTQHVFAKLITALPKYDDRGTFFSWLVRLARNVAIDHLRAMRELPSELVLDPDAAGEHDLEQSLSVRTALASLPEDQRKVVVLRHIVGLSSGEIAGHMGRTESSIHGLHHRGRRALRDQLVRLESAPATNAPAPIAA
jgi:RNA polymerase sigma-70 factor (ECF subfamily)